jgi:hypothetical protein
MSQYVIVDSTMSHDHVPTEKSRRSRPGPLHVDPALGFISQLVEHGGADVDVVASTSTACIRSAKVVVSSIVRWAMPSEVLTPVDNVDLNAGVPAGPLIHAVSSDLPAAERVGVGV